MHNFDHDIMVWGAMFLCIILHLMGLVLGGSSSFEVMKHALCTHKCCISYFPHLSHTCGIFFLQTPTSYFLLIYLSV